MGRETDFIQVHDAAPHDFELETRVDTKTALELAKCNNKTFLLVAVNGQEIPKGSDSWRMSIQLMGSVSHAPVGLPEGVKPAYTWDCPGCGKTMLAFSVPSTTMCNNCYLLTQ